MAMMNVSIASEDPLPLVPSPHGSEQQAVRCAGKGLWWCLNPMANLRQAALERKVEDLNSKLEEAMNSQDSLSQQLLDAMTKQNALEQQVTKLRSENDDLRQAGVSFRKTAAWKVKNSLSAITAGPAQK